MKIALLMGSFNPIHNGHVEVARFVIDNKIADAVWCIVSPQNPLKDVAEVSFEDRLAMAKLAFEDDLNIQVSDIEDALPRPSYTFNTIVELKRQNPNDEFFMLCGSDIVNQLDKWYKVEQLREMVDFLVYPRGQGECSAEFKGAHLFDVSSTCVRESVRLEFLPTKVYQYILSEKLYVDGWGETEFYKRGMIDYSNGNFGAALNWFKKALAKKNDYLEAKEMADMVSEILAYRYTDIYNP